MFKIYLLIGLLGNSATAAIPSICLHKSDSQVIARKKLEAHCPAPPPKVKQMIKAKAVVTPKPKAKK